MTITFKTISNSRRTPGVETEINLSAGSLSLAATKQRLMLVGQRMDAKISTPSFVSGTLNDCTLGTDAAFTGSLFRKFIVMITTATTTDIFKWSKDGGAIWTLSVNCSTSSITLAEGVTIKFGAITGHALNDSWTFFAFPAGTVAQKVPTSFQGLGEVQSGCGSGSILYRMAKAVMAMMEQYGIIDANFTSVNDAAGTAAAGSITVTGPATAAGYLRVRIGNERFEVGFAAGDAAVDIAYKMKLELDKSAEDLPVTVHRLAGTLAQLVFTAKNLGTLGNDIILATEFTANAGVGTTNVAMASGATDPANFADALDAFQSTRYHVIGSALNDATNLGLLTTHLDAVSGSSAQKFAIGVFGSNNATLATVTTLASGLNHMRLVCKYLRGSLSAGYEIAAAFAALKTYIEDPSLPLNDLQLFGLHVPAVVSRFIETEIETLLWNGVSPLVVDNQERVSVVRVVTTDISNAQLVDVTTICGWDYYRYAVRARLIDVFKQAKNLPNTPAAVVTQVIFVAQQCEAQEMGVTNVAAYKDKFTAETDATDPTRINVSVPSPIIPGLQRICARFDLYY